MEECKSSGDAAWLAAAQESFYLASALFAEASLLFPSSHSQKKSSATSQGGGAKELWGERASRELWLTLPVKLASSAASYHRLSFYWLAVDSLRQASLIMRLLGRPASSMLFGQRAWSSCLAMESVEDRALALTCLLRDLEKFEEKPLRRILFWKVRLAACLRHLRQPEAALSLLSKARLALPSLSPPLHMQILKESLVLAEQQSLGTPRSACFLDSEAFVRVSLEMLLQPTATLDQQGALVEGIRRWSLKNSSVVTDKDPLPLLHHLHVHASYAPLHLTNPV